MEGRAESRGGAKHCRASSLGHAREDLRTQATIYRSSRIDSLPLRAIWPIPERLRAARPKGEVP